MWSKVLRGWLGAGLIVAAVAGAGCGLGEDTPGRQLDAARAAEVQATAEDPVVYGKEGRPDYHRARCYKGLRGGGLIALKRSEAEQANLRPCMNCRPDLDDAETVAE